MSCGKKVHTVQLCLMGCPLESVLVPDGYILQRSLYTCTFLGTGLWGHSSSGSGLNENMYTDVIRPVKSKCWFSIKTGAITLYNNSI